LGNAIFPFFETGFFAQFHCVSYKVLKYATLPVKAIGLKINDGAGSLPT